MLEQSELDRLPIIGRSVQTLRSRLELPFIASSPKRQLSHLLAGATGFERLDGIEKLSHSSSRKQTWGGMYYEQNKLC